MGQSVVQIDAFTAERFRGNPAAVCLMDGPADEEWMQSVALEMNLSETAFLYPEGDRYSLRWFTPIAEVDLCGHATLASAFLLFTDKHLSVKATATFDTKSGELRATKDGKWIQLDFPCQPIAESEAPEGLIDALGVEPVFVGRRDKRYLVEVATEADVRGATPNFSKLALLPVRGLILTAPGDKEFDFVSRFFAPDLGIDEDPVTGSAHCVLGPYWQAKLGKNNLKALQASRRSGVVQVRLADSRVYLKGQAVITMRGELV